MHTELQGQSLKRNTFQAATCHSTRQIILSDQNLNKAVDFNKDTRSVQNIRTHQNIKIQYHK